MPFPVRPLGFVAPPVVPVNAIVPFVRPAVAIAVGATVAPKPLPVLMGIGAFLAGYGIGSGLLWLAQRWGQLGSRPPTRGPLNPVSATVSGTRPADGNTTPALFTVTRKAGQVQSYSSSLCTVAGTFNYTQAVVISEPNVVEAAFTPGSGTCGIKDYKWTVKLSDGTTKVLNPPPYGDYGFKSTTVEMVSAFAGPSQSSTPQGPPLPLPDGYVVPQPVVDPRPKAPPRPRPQPEPQPPPQPQPLPEPVIVPITPGPTAPPKVAPQPPVRPQFPPQPQEPIDIKDDGTLPKPKPDPPTVTNPDWHFPIPGGGPVTGNGPQAKPEEIAKELGRLEQKLNAVLNPTPDTPIEWQRVIGQVIEALVSLTAGTTYTLTEQCEQCDPANPVQPASVSVGAPGAINALGVIANKVDAVAELLNAQLGLKQKVCPPCRPKAAGQLVTVNFSSDSEEVPSKNRVLKTLSYRDQSGKPESAHLAHWDGFFYDTGGAIVISKGLPWGIVQVWAATVAEGKRVIAHAAAIAGVNLGDPKHEWVVSSTDHPRYGRQARVYPVAWDRTGKLMISKRIGPSGSPSYERDP